MIMSNVFISGLLSKKGPPGQILDAWLEGKFSLLSRLRLWQRFNAYWSIRAFEND
jgi:predicted nucleic acid-binding protein